MKKIAWKPGTMLYPLPAVLVTCRNKAGKDNIITIAWVGTVNSDPPMVSISVRKERYSHHMIKETMEFAINMTTEKIVKAVDYCGVKTGSKVDKFDVTGLTRGKAINIRAPLINECPLSLECKVVNVIELGSHDMFIGEIKTVVVDEALIDEKGKLHLYKAGLICFSHGEYFGLKNTLGHFGFSVKKNNKQSSKKQANKNQSNKNQSELKKQKNRR